MYYDKTSQALIALRAVMGPDVFHRTLREYGRRWTDVAGARSIEALVWPGQCSDGMSDRAWTHRAAVRVDTLTYRGCADQT
jgi:uncharacterized membrane protein